MKIQFKVKVHSDRDIEKPYPFMAGVFEQFVPSWHLVSTVGQTMTAESIVFDVEPDFDPTMLFESITPNMFPGNMERSYKIVA